MKKIRKGFKFLTMVGGIAGALLFASCDGAATSLAQCPNRADLEAGTVTLQRYSPLFKSEFTIRSNRLHELRRQLNEISNTNETVRYQYYNALFPATRSGSSGLIQSSFSPKPSSPLPPEGYRGGSYRSSVVVDKSDQYDIRTKIRKRGIGTIKIASCSYEVDVYRVSDHFSDGETLSQFDQYYAPKLGLIVRSDKLDGFGNIVSTVRYDWISFRPATP